MKTYQFETYFATTDQDLSHLNPIASWDVNDEQVALIELGANIEVVDGSIIIEDLPEDLVQ